LNIPSLNASNATATNNAPHTVYLSQTILKGTIAGGVKPHRKIS